MAGLRFTSGEQLGDGSDEERFTAFSLSYPAGRRSPRLVNAMKFPA
jgi:hypothetical protein